jgi:hypothetical protein
VFLDNHSVFREMGRATTLVVELNHVSGKQGTWLVVPQAYQRLRHRTMLQVGGGVQKSRGERRTEVASLRLIGEF